MPVNALPHVAPPQVAPAAIPNIPIPGWAPRDLKTVTSRRTPGLIGGLRDVLRGVEENGQGQPLTKIQQAALGTYLSGAMAANPVKVFNELGKVRLYIGGPVANLPGTAMTIGPNVYVPTERDLRSITSYENRDWLAHEVAHTVQALRGTTAEQPVRERRFLAEYFKGLAVDDRLRPGAIPRGVVEWVDENINPFNPDRSHVKLQSAVHDAHHMEKEAAKVAEGFQDRTPNGATDSAS